MIFSVEVGDPTDSAYDRAKKILNIGRHPTFIGRSQTKRWATNGGLLFFAVDGEDRAVAMIDTRRSILMVLCVVPSMRGTGFGTAIVDYIKANWVRAVESAVPFFEKRGYTRVGEWKQGRTLRTGILVRTSLISLAGRLRKALNR